MNTTAILMEEKNVDVEEYLASTMASVFIGKIKGLNISKGMMKQRNGKLFGVIQAVNQEIKLL